MRSSLLKYSIVTLFALFISCQKDKETISDLIAGKWEWVKTIFPYSRQVSNPKSVGFSETLEFIRDGKMNEYRNDSLLATSGYKIKTDSSAPDYFVLTDFVLTNSSIIGSHFYIADDSLIFNDAYVDGPVISYIRKN